MNGYGYYSPENITIKNKKRFGQADHDNKHKVFDRVFTHISFIKIKQPIMFHSLPVIDSVVSQES